MACLAFQIPFNVQVVPFGKFHTPDASTSSNSTSENIGHELQSEPPES